MLDFISLVPQMRDSQASIAYQQKALEQLGDQVRNKIDCDLFDDEVDRIKTLLINH